MTANEDDSVKTTYQENIVIASGQTITLDLNGQILDGGDQTGSGRSKAAITNRGTLTLTDSSAVTNEDGSVTYAGCVMREDTALENGNGQSAYYVIKNEGEMTIEGGNITNDSGPSTRTGTWSGASLIDNSGDLTIDGGNLQQDNFIVIKNEPTGTLTVSDGTITTENAWKRADAIQNWGTAEITGGTINGGYVNSWSMTGAVGSMTISGDPVINSTVTRSKYNGTEYATVSVRGGTYKSAPTSYIANGYGYIINENGTRSVVSAEGYFKLANTTQLYKTAEERNVAASFVIGGTDYYSIQSSARTAANTSGATVQMLKGAKYFDTSANQTITLDLNGQTLGGATVGYGFTTVAENSTLKIIDTAGTAVVKSNVSSKGVVYDVQMKEGATLIIEGGTYDTDVSRYVTTEGYEAVHNESAGTWTVGKKQFTVTFVDADGNVLSTQTVPYGEMPNNYTPESYSNGNYNYTFAGWDSEFSRITGEVTYKASFNATLIPVYVEPVAAVEFEDETEPEPEISIEEEATPLAALPEELAQVTKEDAIELAAELGIIDIETFAPKAEATAETVSVALAVFADEETDVAAIVEEAGLANAETVTREQLITVLFKLAESQGFDVSAAADLSAYTDAGELSDFAVAAMQWAVEVGLLKGIDATTLAPGQTLTQEQLIIILARFAALIQ